MIYYLTVSVNGERKQTIELNDLPAYSLGKVTVGRADDNDVVLPFAAVSRHHAVIDFSGEKPEISDAGSLNKLRVGGKAYERIKISNGLKVLIGTSENNVTLHFTTLDEVAPRKVAEKPAVAEMPKPAPEPKQPKPEAVYEAPKPETAYEAPKPQVSKTFTQSTVGARVFAFLTDFTICMFMGLGSAIIILLLLNSILSGIKVIIMLTFFISLFIIWLYFALGDSGPSKGTMGKMALGLWVIDIKTGDRISFGKASKRFFAKILSTLILFIGYLPVFGKKQTLHDYIAGTVVVKNPRAIEK